MTTRIMVASSFKDQSAGRETCILALRNNACVQGGCNQGSLGMNVE